MAKAKKDTKKKNTKAEAESICKTTPEFSAFLKNKKFNEEILQFIEYTAAEDGWFDDSRGWSILNRLREAVGRPKVTPVNEPTGDYFASDGVEK